MSQRFFASAWIAAAVVAAGIVAPATAQDTALRVRLNADIRSTDPGVNRDGNTDMVMSHLVEGLVAYREDTTIGPMLAETISASADGLSYTFKLRSGIKFHNGEPLTSADVKFSWERYLKKEINWRCLPEFDGRGVAKITAIETPDPATIVFKIEKPAALFLASMARTDCGQSGIWHKASLNADGSWKDPIGTGPFVLGEWRKGQFVELKRFANYVARAGEVDGLTGNKSAMIETIRLMIVPDAAASKAALLANSIDMIPDVDEVEAEDIKRRPGLRIASTPTLGAIGVLLQTRDPILKDVRIRRALALSLDYAELVKALLGDAAGYNASAIPAASAYHKGAHKTGYKRDLMAAKKLLVEAGYKGETIKLLTNKRYTSLYEMAVLVQAMAADAGLKVEFEVMDWATQLDHYSKGTYTAMPFAYSARFDPTLSYDMFSGPKDKQPRKVWDNPLAQAQIDQSGAITDSAGRQALFDALHTQMLDDVPVIWLYNNAALAALGPRIGAYKTWITEQPRFWAVALKP